MLAQDSNYDLPGTPVYEIRDAPVMELMMNVMEKMIGLERLELRAKGDAIPKAVAVANIITEKAIDGGTRVENIRVDSEDVLEMGRINSIIEIVLAKTR